MMNREVFMSSPITAALVQELRARTGGGYMDCQKALKEANGAIEVAIDIMRKSGQAKAAKTTSRTAAEGMILINVSLDSKAAIMLEVNCETDFVARDENFQKFAKQVAARALEEKVGDVDKLLNLPWEKGSAKTINTAREEVVTKIGENIQVRRLLYRSTSNYIDYYLHGTRIGVLVELSIADKELGKDIAMHVAASMPKYISAKDVPASELEREKAIYLAQAIESGKPQAIAEKMVAGKLQKFAEETTLLGQPFVKNPDIKVADLLKSKNAEVLFFSRYAVGEGIEKKVVDFAAEVAAQIK